MDITRASGALGAGSIPAGGTIYLYALANPVIEEIYVGLSRDVAQHVRKPDLRKSRTGNLPKLIGATVCRDKELQNHPGASFGIA
jgi:hypothetical protein